MPHITDWLMVAITAIYVIATILICLANWNSAKATKAQLDESKKQFQETQRLQAMPYLQVKLMDGKFDEHNNPLPPYTTFEVTDSSKGKPLTLVKTISFVNSGLGMLHHTKVLWNSKSKKNDQYPVVDVVLPPNKEWLINAEFTALKPEDNKIENFKAADCSINIQYEDLLGNTYEQDVQTKLIICFTEIRIIHYYITSPKLITGTF